MSFFGGGFSLLSPASFDFTTIGCTEEATIALCQQQRAFMECLCPTELGIFEREIAVISVSVDAGDNFTLPIPRNACMQIRMPCLSIPDVSNIGCAFCANGLLLHVKNLAQF
jgi:hypothetical protein